MTVVIDPLTQVLREARGRLRTQGLIWLPVAALLTGSLAGVGVGLWEAAQRLGWVEFDINLPTLPVIAGAAAIGAFGAAIVYLWQRKLRESRAVALLVDGRAGMNLAYATAIETTEQATPGRVAAALMRTARERAEQLDIPRLLPLWTNRLRKTSVTGLALAAIAVALHFAMPPLPQSAGQQQAQTQAPAAEQTRAAARELAEKLALEATLRKDPVLAAIAKALEERVADSAPDAEADKLNDELSALLDQARSAFGDNIPNWLGDQRLAEDMQGGSDQMAGNSVGQRPDPQGIDTFAVNPEDIKRARQAQAAILEATGNDPDDETEFSGEVTPGSGDSASASSFTPKKMDNEVLQAAGRESAGAAQESGKGRSDQAGQGSRELQGQSLTEGEGEGPLELPQAAQETGRRIRITLPPSADSGAGPLAASGTAQGQAGEATTHTMERSAIPANSRAVVRQYFERPSE
jgi:hypothetical protein